ncbi:tetratricopeptide repeat protein [Streptomyces ipomoeae]|nr:tetratricopeptide repeat protein [Streptomyces ipomoeae]MDX2694620.1 tetratricopeptide repeat protein [Streptomyces ipomoeae]MDX2822197.1 tetratricopeptide repeat protein [Streptomyces ipomoeae]MDX2840522.1 tetratricopeptide repeat protein [Streptomyces ipomoeae]MDX2874122.1 tetratricopeptide repeat protein [Streptomyces ipomoeae]TQE24236.1 tetratricopeptide repeat protein [Streptomyces ipomoeae]
MRDSHRGDAERVLIRAVEEEVRRSGGRVDGVVLLGRARAALDTMAQNAAEEYEAYTRALDESEAGRLTFAQRYAREGAGTPLLVAAVAAGTAVVADLSFGVDPGTAVSTGVIVGVASAVATVLKVTASHLPAAHHHAGALSQPGGPEQLRLQWLTALEVRGIRPFLDQQRVLAASTPKKTAPRLRGADKSAAARRRNVLEQSFTQLPETDDRFADRRSEMAKIRQWVQAARAETETRPTVVVLHGAPGSGRTALAVRATHDLRDYFRGACVVDLRADSPGETPLSTRDALMHLLNRLGAPRDQLLFRERTSQDQQVKRLSELYHQHLTALPVTIVLDDASDPEQVRALVPERSDSLVLVTARGPLALPADLPAWVHQLPVDALDGEGTQELLTMAAKDPSASNDAESVARIRQLCGGLPLALRIAGSSLGPRTPHRLAADLSAYGPVEPIERALWLRYTDQSEPSRRLLRRLALAGRASLGAAAAASLLATDETEATRHLTALARAGLIDHVHGNRYRLHDLVRAFAQARLLDEEEPSERTSAQERLIVTYADLADSVLRLVDGNMSTRSDRFGSHGFVSLDEALRWLDDETSFITSTLRHAEGVNQAAVLSLLGALCDYCLLRGDLYRLGELSELAQSVDQGLLTRSVQWRTGIAARQLGELDKARTTLSSVVDLYMETNHDAGAARALCSLGITLHHQGNLTEAADKLIEALHMQSVPQLAADRAWTMHALAAVERDRSHLADALDLLNRALVIHRQQDSLHGEAWAHFQLGQLLLRMGDVPGAETELRTASDLFGRTRDPRGQAWSMTQLARARIVAGDPSTAIDGLRQALSQHRDNEDARGEAWTGYYLGQALEETGNLDQAVRELERSRTMFSRMRDVYGLACARHHSARVTRDQRAVQTGSLRNSGFARQLLVDARADFQRIGVAHGEAWTCLELAVVDAGNNRTPQALALCDEAAHLFTSYGDRRGEDWARFLRCTMLPYAAPGGVEIGTAVAQEELAQLARTSHPLRDEKLDEYVEAYQLLLERGVNLEGGWRGWTLGMVPNRHAREVMGVPVTAQQR